MSSPLFQTDHYWLHNASIPISLIVNPDPAIIASKNREDLSVVDLEIRAGKIAQIQPTGSVPPAAPTVDLQRGQVWPCFVDMHTHLDKGHMWERQPNLLGTFDQAIEDNASDRRRWSDEDLYQRIQFGLKCSYAHGTQAIRTHIDSLENQAYQTLKVIKQLQAEWQDRIRLQVAALTHLEIFLTEEADPLADAFAEVGGCLGGATFPQPELDQQLDRVFALAKDRQLDLDFHCDETGDPAFMTLRHVATAAIRNRFERRITCGHCCSLAVQDPEVANKTMDLVKEAGISIVSLPMCNLFLQARDPGHTPRWRGITLVHELKSRGIPVAFASDNCRDPFYGFGDHDMLEVFTQSTRIAQLDTPDYDTWPQSVTTTPADQMGLPEIARIQIGGSADLVLFKARYFSELLSRPQIDRIVLRQGKSIDTTLPDYAELDPLIEG